MEKGRARGRGAKPQPGPPQTTANPGGAAKPTTAGVARARARAPQNVSQAPVVSVEVGGGDIGIKKMEDLKLGGSGSTTGSDTNTIGRGQVRGRRVAGDGSVGNMKVTKRTDLASKRAVHYNKNITPANFFVNYFKVTKRPTWTLNLYRVDFNPEEDVLVIKKALLRDHKSKIGAYIFDGTLLFTANTIQGGAIKFHSKKFDETKVEITLKHVRTLEHGDYAYLQLYNILLRNVLEKMQLQLVGRQFFDPIAKQVLAEYHLELWPGYSTVMRQHETDVLLNVEITHKQLRQDNMLQLWEKLNKDRNRFSDTITGTTIMTKYNNKTYRIDDVDFSTTPQNTFLMKDKSVSYIEYYATKYQTRITNVNQPMLVHKSKPRDLRAGQSELIYLVPELCFATGIDDSMRNDFKFMKAMGAYTRLDPQKRIQKLNEFRKRVETSEAKDVFAPWELALDKQLTSVSGHVIPSEKILFGAGSPQIFANEEADFTNAFRNCSMLHSMSLDKWCVLFTQSEAQNTRGFVDMIIQVARAMKFNIAAPRPFTIPNDRAQTYVAELEKILSTEQFQFVVCIVPNNQNDRYAAIKKKCSIDRAVPSQVILRKNLIAKGAKSIATKIAVQINCKLGGAPWTLDIPMKGIMIIGFDVTHDTEKKGNSFGALVASLDNTCSSYYSAVSHHNTGNEISSEIASNIVFALQKYKERNTAFPKAIVMYRDGVGEGQLNQVIDHELGEIKKAITASKAYGENEIPLTFVVVTKRISTRIMTDKNNPRPGSVVDDVITCPERYDFFLVSQSVRQGTVSPTYYNVIYDTNRMLHPDRLQRLSYKLCHLYFNWSGTVRVPAPCQYAHKLAFLCGQALHRAPANELDTLLHFL